MRRSLILGLVTLALAGSLAACGGGGSPTILPSTAPPTRAPSTVNLKGGFEEALTTSTRSLSRGIPHLMAIHTQGVGLGGSIVPTNIFVIADPYITTAPGGITGAQVVAYLTTSDGSMNGIPNPLPTATFTQSGNPVPVTGTPMPAPSPLPSSPPVIISALPIGAPVSLGQTTFTITATVNGTPLSATALADTYRGMCLAAPDNNQPDGCLGGATFDGNGASLFSATPDIYLTQSSGLTYINVPYGGQEQSVNIDQTQQGTFTPTGTQFSIKDFTGTPISLVFKTAAGTEVRWEPFAFDAGNSTNGGITAGDVGDVYGPYMVGWSY